MNLSKIEGGNTEEEIEASEMLIGVRAVHKGIGITRESIINNLSKTYQQALKKSLNQQQYYQSLATDAPHLKNIKTLLNLLNRLNNIATLIQDIMINQGALGRLKNSAIILGQVKDLLNDFMMLDIKADLNIIKPFLQGNIEGFQSTFEAAIPTLETNLGLGKGTFNSEDNEIRQILKRSQQPVENYHDFLLESLITVKQFIVNNTQDVILKKQKDSKYYLYQKSDSEKTSNTKALLNVMSRMENIAQLVADRNLKSDPENDVYAPIKNSKIGGTINIAFKILDELKNIYQDAEKVDFTLIQEALGDTYDGVLDSIYTVLEGFAKSADLFEAQMGLEQGLLIDKLDIVYDVFYSASTKHNKVKLLSQRNKARREMLDSNTTKIADLEMKRDLLKDQIGKDIYKEKSIQSKTHLLSDMAQVYINNAMKILSIDQNKAPVMRFAEAELGIDISKLTAETINVLTVLKAIADHKLGDDRKEFITLMKNKLAAHLDKEPTEYSSRALTTTPKVFFKELESMLQKLNEQYLAEINNLLLFNQVIGEHHEKSANAIIDVEEQLKSRTDLMQEIRDAEGKMPKKEARREPEIESEPEIIKPETKQRGLVAEFLLAIVKTVGLMVRNFFKKIINTVFPSTKVIKKQDGFLIEAGVTPTSPASDTLKSDKESMKTEDRDARPKLDQDLLQSLLEIKISISTNTLDDSNTSQLFKFPLPEGIRELRAELNSLTSSSTKDTGELIQIMDKCTEILSERVAGEKPVNRNQNIHDLYLNANKSIEDFKINYKEELSQKKTPDPMATATTKKQ